jgi:RNA polymerase sigma factor (sigma-70 family)
MSRETDEGAEDAALVEAWQAGDRSAGERLFDRYFDPLHRFFDHKTAVDPADLVQRTFLGCVEARQRFRGACSFRTFLYAIARNELRAHYRSHKRGVEIDFGVSSLADLAASPSTLARRASDREVLEASLRSLPVDLQIAIELRFWEGMSGPELAQVLDVAEGTVRSRLRRALEALQQALLANEADPRLMSLRGGAEGEDLEAWAGRLREAVSME